MTDNALKIFSGNATPALASSICEYLDLELGRIHNEESVSSLFI